MEAKQSEAYLEASRASVERLTQQRFDLQKQVGKAVSRKVSILRFFCVDLSRLMLCVWCFLSEMQSLVVSGSLPHDNVIL